MDYSPKSKATLRQRGENWTQDEKDLLIEIMRQAAPIIECKQTDTNSNKKKHNEWLKVQKKLEKLSGKRRVIKQIKGFWRRLKLTAKTNISKHKKTVKLTGGGQRPQSTSDEDQKMFDLRPTHFIIETKEFDSDGILMITIPDKRGNSEVENAIYDCEINENTNNQIDLSVLKKVITVDEEESKEINEETEIESKIALQPTSNIIGTNKLYETERSHKSAITQSNIDIKQRTLQLVEEEYSIKVKYQKQELSHQKLRHKLEIDLLLLEKEKKELEIKILKNASV